MVQIAGVFPAFMALCHNLFSCADRWAFPAFMAPSDMGIPISALIGADRWAFPAFMAQVNI